MRKKRLLAVNRDPNVRNYYKFCRRGFNLQEEEMNPQEEEINPQKEEINPQEEKVNPQEEKMNLQEEKWTLSPGLPHVLKYQGFGQTGHQKWASYY